MPALSTGSDSTDPGVAGASDFSGVSGTVLAVCRVAQLLSDPGTIGVTAIDKRPVGGPVRVRLLGLHADVQADRKHHGGEDQAVYAYAERDAEHFAAILGRPIDPGLFGENLRVAGVEVTDAVIGERWRIGDTAVLEVTLPRIPCGTFARRMREDKWVKRFAAEGRPGAYLRVVKSGPVSAGDPIIVLARPEHGVTIGDVFAGLRPEQADALLVGGTRLPEKLRLDAERVRVRALTVPRERDEPAAPRS